MKILCLQGVFQEFFHLFIVQLWKLNLYSKSEDETSMKLCFSGELLQVEVFKRRRKDRLYGHFAYRENLCKRWRFSSTRKTYQIRLIVFVTLRKLRLKRKESENYALLTNNLMKRCLGIYVRIKVGMPSKEKEGKTKKIIFHVWTGEERKTLSMDFSPTALQFR